MNVRVSDVWLDAFERQADGSLFVKARRHARWCLFAYRLPRGDSYADDLVQGALTDILERRIEWDPEEHPLLRKVCDVIRYRVRDEKESLPVRTPHFSFYERKSPRDRDDPENVDGAPWRVDQEALSVLVEQPEDPEAQLGRAQERAIGARLGAELEALVADDAHVAEVVRCLRAGIIKKADILAETGMSDPDYRNAARRFERLTKKLPAELRALAMGDDDR